MNDGAKGIEKDALFFMAGAVLGYSLTPLVVVLAGGDSPFLFNAGWRLGLVIGFMTFAWAKYRDVLRIPSVTSDIRNALKSPAILATAISNFDYALFVLATMVIHVTAATVIFETWPLWMILMLALAYRGEDRYQKTVLFTVAMIGNVCGRPVLGHWQPVRDTVVPVPRRRRGNDALGEEASP